MKKIALLLLRLSKWSLIRYIESLPDQDAYSEVYSMLADIITYIDNSIKELPEAIENVAVELENDPDQLPLQRAKDWCYYPKD